MSLVQLKTELRQELKLTPQLMQSMEVLQMTSQELLEAVTPEVGIISVGQNRFGHPTQEAMDRMIQAGMELRRTDEEGNILIQVGK